MKRKKQKNIENLYNFFRDKYYEFSDNYRSASKKISKHNENKSIYRPLHLKKQKRLQP